VERPDTKSWVPFRKFGNSSDVGSIAWLQTMTEPGDLVRIRFRLPNNKMYYTSLDPRKCKPSDSGLPGTAELDLARKSMGEDDFSMLASVSLSSLSYGDSNGAAHAARAAAALQFAPSGFYEILTGTDISRKAVLVKNMVHMSMHERAALLTFFDGNPYLVAVLNDCLTRTPLSAVEDLVSVDEGALFWLTDEVARRSINAGFTDGFDRDGYDMDGFNISGYDKDGFDRFGYNKDGFDRGGYGADGFDRDGSHRNGTRYDEDGFDRFGCDKDGFDCDGYAVDGFNRAGYNKDGFDKYGFDVAGIHEKTGTGYDTSGFDAAGYNEITDTRYDWYGFDKDGYNKDGYNKDGYNKDGFDRTGSHKITGSRYDEDGFDRFGYNKDGFDRGGVHKRTGSEYGEDGFDRFGYDRRGFDRGGIHKITGSQYNKDGYNRDGFDRIGIHKITGTSYGEDGFDCDGYAVDGFNRAGYNERGFDKYGFDVAGIHEKTGTGYDTSGFDAAGYNEITGTRYDWYGFDKDGYNKDGYNKDGYNKDGYNKDGFDRDGIHRNGTRYDEAGFDRDGRVRVDVKELASNLEFTETRKQAKTYEFVSPDGSLPPMSYTVADTERVVVTTTADGVETTNTAIPGDVIMSGPSGELYVVKSGKFASLYEGTLGAAVIPNQSPRRVTRYTGGTTVVFTAPWGEDMVLKPGDYLVADGEGFYRIAREEFEKTYDPLTVSSHVGPVAAAGNSDRQAAATQIIDGLGKVVGIRMLPGEPGFVLVNYRREVDEFFDLIRRTVSPDRAPQDNLRLVEEGWAVLRARDRGFSDNLGRYLEHVYSLLRLVNPAIAVDALTAASRVEGSSKMVESSWAGMEQRLLGDRMVDVSACGKILQDLGGMLEEVDRNLYILDQHLANLREVDPEKLPRSG
jgi:hypothetical protein